MLPLHAKPSRPDALLLAAGALLGVALLASTARAQPDTSPPAPAPAPDKAPDKVPAARPRVLLAAAPEGAKDLSALLQAELTALAIVVIVESGTTPAETDAAAVLRISVEPRSVSVWTASTMRLRTYASDPRRPAGSDEALARQIAEVLRAELLLAPKPSPPPPSPPSPPSPLPPPPSQPTVPRGAPAVPPVDQLVAPPTGPAVPPTGPVGPGSPLSADPYAPRPRPLPQASPRTLGALAVAPAMTLSPGSLPPLAQLRVGLRMYVWRGLRLRISGDLPLVPAVVEHPRGDVVASTTMAALSLGYDLAEPESLRVVPSVGAGWQWMGVTGRANPPYLSSRDSAHLAHLFAGLDAAVSVAPWLWLVAGARVGVIAPRVTISVAGEDLGAFGRPAVQLFAGAAVPIVMAADGAHD